MIEDRNLKAGQKLVAAYRKQDYSCTMKSTKDGLRFVLDDGREFKSPSSAASAVMGGQSANGWRFWSIEGDAKPKSSAGPVKAPKAEHTIKPMKDDPTRFWCSGCMDSFPVTEGETSAACPQGHTNEAAEASGPKAAKKAPAKPRTTAKAKA
jgi:hypothetical protein